MLAWAQGRRPQSMRVALIYAANPLAGKYFLPMTAYEANFTARYDTMVFVKKAPSTAPAAALASVKAVAADYPGVTVLDQTQFKAQTAKPINQMLGLVYALLLLARAPYQELSKARSEGFEPPTF